MDDKTYLSAAEVMKRYGVSSMSVWRWERDPELGFPQAMRINRRRFWLLVDLEAWESRQRGEAA